MNKSLLLILMMLTSLVFLSCSTQQEIVQVESQVQPEQNETVMDEPVLKRTVAIARFSNETLYGKGIFYDQDADPLGKQAVDILSTRLASSNKFILLERQDLDKILKEQELSGENNYQQVGADYIIVGSITEFGRKNIADNNVFSKKKTQIVEAAVSLRLIDVSTGQIIYTEEAKGEAETTTKQVLGVGESAGFDASLSDKAISAAISKLVGNVINNCMERPWRSYFLSMEDGQTIISGGKEQGITVGDEFLILERGKKVKNPQTGMFVELPGKEIGKVKVLQTMGTDPNNEFSMVEIIEGTVNEQSLSNYIIQENIR